MDINQIIENGINNAPCVGGGGEFFKYQFCYSHDEWEQRTNKAKDSGMETLRQSQELFPNSSAGGYDTIHKDGFVYFYEVDSRGDLSSTVFTHEVIAYGGHLKKEEG